MARPDTGLYTGSCKRTSENSLLGTSVNKGKATITFFGEPTWTPEPGDRVVLRVADGSWREGFRCVSAPFVEDRERRVWVAPRKST